MGGKRAVIASLGASISIVACAALGLFAVSVLFAYPGIAGSLNGSGSSATLVVATRVPAKTAKVGSEAAVRPLRVSAPAPHAPTSQRASVKSPARPALHTSAGTGHTRRPTQTATVADIAPVVAPPAVTPPAVATRKAGDGVRELGATLTGTVKQAGDGLGTATKPLGPPVSKALQTVLNLAVKAVNDLLKQTTGAVAGVLDSTTHK